MAQLLSQAQKQQAAAARHQLYCERGFGEIVGLSDANHRISQDLSQYLRKEHGLTATLRPTIVRRWFARDIDHWQEPRVTVGMIILEWWESNRESYVHE